MNEMLPMLVLGALFLGVLALPKILAHLAGVLTVGPKEARRLVQEEGALLLDVREAMEWKRQRIPGARHVPLGQVSGRVRELGKFRQGPVVVHCASGNRSLLAAQTLRKQGFEKVYNLSGGLGAWAAAGLPTE